MQFKQLAISALFTAAAAQNSSSSLVAALGSNSQLSALSQLISSDPGLVSSLSNATNVTLLAPSNSAMNLFLNSSLGQSLTTIPGAVTALLQYHVLNGVYNSSAIANSSTFVRSQLTNPSFANVTGGQRVEAIRVGSNVTFYSGNFDNSTVTTANITFSGGIIHVINRVLTIPPRLNTTLINADARSLYGALNRTGLLSVVGGLSDVTIFAPSNAAIQAISNIVSNATTDTLRSVLSYHVVAGNGTAPYYSTRLTNGTSLTTLNGANITIHRTSNATFVNGARVVTSNVLIAGGVVHVIDAVLNPSNTTFAGSPTSGAVAFPSATSASDIPFTSGVTSRTTSLGGGAASATSAAAAGSSTSRAGAAMAVPTGGVAVGAAALFGAAGVLVMGL